jgi:hypothetical protein
VSDFYFVSSCHLQKYRSCVDRVSRTSLVLAMILPHALFVGVGIVIKLLFPTIVTWLANETYAILILSQVYPWIWTISLLFQYRHASTIKSNTLSSEEEEKPKPPLSPSVKSVSEKYEKAILRTSTSRINNRIPTSNKIKASSKAFPRSTSKVAQDPKQSKVSAKQPLKPVHRLVKARQGESNTLEQDATYWLQFWTINCLFTAACRVIYLLPIVGRMVSRTQLLRTASIELKLFFYLWIYGLSSVLTSTASSDADMQRSYVVRPLPFLSQKLLPSVRNFYQSTSHTISTDSWDSLVKRAESFLNVAVMVRLISESTQKRIMELLKYSHPFLVPAITLLMPGFITEYGVLYVNTIIPAAKNVTSLSETAASLQYWVLHILFSAILSSCSNVLWWIPFSTHVTFVLWCHLQYTSCRYYTILEQELQAFGLLPKGEADVVPVDQTVTAIMFRAIAKSLPSASQLDADSPIDDATSNAAATATDTPINVDTISNQSETILEKNTEETLEVTSQKERSMDDCQSAAEADVAVYDISKPGDDCKNEVDSSKTIVDSHLDLDLTTNNMQASKSDQQIDQHALPPESPPLSPFQSSSLPSVVSDDVSRPPTPKDIIKQNRVRRSTRLNGNRNYATE